MKIIKAAILLVALVASAVPSAPAFAQRGQGQGQHLRGGHQHARHHGGHQHARQHGGHQHVRHHGGHHHRHHHHGHRHHGHGHAHFGFFFGAPLVWPPWYYPPNYYYYPPAAVVPSAPPVYIEKGEQGAAPADDAQYWYYCRESEAYYPYVKECPGPWQKVVPYSSPS